MVDTPLFYEGKGNWTSDPVGDVVPTPAPGDAGKVVTVNGAETGYELDTPAAGGQWGGADTARFTSEGDPNGIVVALATGDLCVDTATPALYQAPGAGTVWTRIGGPDTDQWGAASTAQFTYDGDPNGNVTALAKGDLCVDTYEPALWLAAGAGTVWELISNAVLYGSGPPNGSVAPPGNTPGQLYVDIDASPLALYFSTFSDDSSWVGIAGGVTGAAGVTSDPLAASLIDTRGSAVTVDNGSVAIACGTGDVEISGVKGLGLSVNDDGTDTLVGLYDANAVVQPAAIPAPTGGAIIDAEARTAITAILNALGAAAGGIGVTK